MLGFFLSNIESNYSFDNLKNDLIENSIFLKNRNLLFKRKTIDKFMDDKAFEETDEYIIIQEGYLLNKTDLFETYNVHNIVDLITSMFTAEGETFFSKFRGCFSGALYIKKFDRLLVYTNQIGDNPIFYFNYNNLYAIGTDVIHLLNFCRDAQIEFNFNEDAAYQMLTYGFMASDDTYVKEVKRLHGGDYLVVENGVVTLCSYHRFSKDKNRFNNVSDDSLIEEIDACFRHAVEIEWNKDDEYNLKHLADLSGGLDSRMNMWVAHTLRDRNVLLLTYSKSGYLDETISQKIANYWKDEMLFKPLDDATYLYDIETNTKMLGGLSLYSGITGGQRLLASLNLKNYGIEHTGMVGDVVLGSFFNSVDKNEHKQFTGMYSERLKERLSDKVVNIEKSYGDYELFLIYTRGFHGACNSHLIRRNYTEVGSPFLNVDFIQLCLDIPLEKRINHYIYKKWILKKYPDAANFIWEKTGSRISDNKVVSFLRKAFVKGPNKIKRVLGKDKMIKYGMNPCDYFLFNNKKLGNYLDQYHEQAYKYVPKNASLRLVQDLKDLYAVGNFSERSMVLTVLESCRLYFGNNDEKSVHVKNK